MRLSRSGLQLLVLLAAQAEAQSTTSPADSLASEAASLFTMVAGEGYSIYTELTALIGAAGSAASPTSTDASSQSATSAPSVSQSSTSSQSTAHRSSSSRTTLQTSTTPTSSRQSSSQRNTLSSSRPSSTSSSILSSSLAGAAASSTATPDVSPPDSNSGHHLVPILVGSILGIVILALLLLLAFLCLRRRRRDPNREGGVTPTSDEIQTWRNSHRNTSYAPLTGFGPEDNLQSEKYAAAVNVRSLDGHDETAEGDSKMHPAYRNRDMRDVVRERTHSALTKEMGMDAGDATMIGALAATTAAGHKRNSIPRKPLPTALPKLATADGAVIRGRSSLDHSTAHEADPLVSPVSPLLRDVPPQASAHHGGHLRNDSRDALLADTDAPATDRDRPSLDREDTFTAALPPSLKPRQSTYTAYQPGVSASPYGPSPTHPAAAVIAAYRDQDRDSPSIPERSPRRRSHGYTPPSGSSSESLDAYPHHRQSVDGRGESPLSPQRSAESPRMPPKGVTYHDFVPVKRSPRSSGAPAAAWGAVRPQESGARRASLGGYGESQRYYSNHRRDGSEDRNTLRLTRSERAVGQAM